MEAANRFEMSFSEGPIDPTAATQPNRPAAGLDSFQLVHIQSAVPKPDVPKRQEGCLGCGWRPMAVFLILPMVYFLWPFHTNFLVLGIDGGLGRGELGRTDTIILGTVSTLRPYVGLLSIPRDLWVPIEDVGENRINTAYFYAEAAVPGSGPQAVANVVQQNFKVPVHYYVILRMDGLLDFINAMGGVDINLPAQMSGFPAGSQHLDGTKALAFARSRAGSDDFARMKQAQLLIKAVMRRVLQPEVWPRLPEIYQATKAVIITNIPFWQWPRLGVSLLRLGQDNLDTRTITREMVHPFTTNQGAQVLAPDWEAIWKVTREMFGRW
ncbi:MAG TPA: LCP family protein [Anaerolineales bacterium]|jgi:LCP family protein required for cell wall assembly